jgi:hypothetical protein
MAVERAVLLSLLTRNADLIPAGLRHPSSGLLRNNVQAVCRRINGKREFSCRVGMSTTRTGKAWGASYILRPNGSAVLLWDPPRTRRR